MTCGRRDCMPEVTMHECGSGVQGVGGRVGKTKPPLYPTHQSL